MKVNDFITELKRVEKTPTLYQWGTFGNKKSQDNRYTLYDCSGLIKGIIWGYSKGNGKYESNGLKDKNDYQLLTTECTNVSSNFNDIAIGEFVWLDGHCGVYIGNKEVIESSPKWENGVQITKLNQRKWLKHGKLKFIDYNSPNNENITDELNNAIKTIAKYIIRGFFGNGHENRKNKIYDMVRMEVNKF